MAGRTYDFWLLDLDGTVVDIEPDYVHEVFDEIGDRIGRSFTDEEATRLWYGSDDGRSSVLERTDVSRETFWETFHEVEDPEARASATFVYDDAADVVPRIRGPVGVVTHCQEYLTGPVLSTLDIEDWFDTVVCCSDDLGWKPDPSPVHAAMDDLGVGSNGHEGALAGDNPSDVSAARNAGLDGVFVDRRGFPHEDRSIDGHDRIADLTELET